MTKSRMVLFLLMVAVMTPSFAYAMSGRDVYDKVQEMRTRMLDRKTEAVMVLYDRGGGKRTRTLTEYCKSISLDAYKILLVFNSPPDLKGVGFLLHARTLADRDLWAYFPEYKRIRRIPTASQDDSFFGSDFSYDDFSGPPNLDDYSFKILRDETVDGKPCHVIEVAPKTPHKYTRYVAWVAKNLWITTKIEYYQEKELYRSGSFRDIRVIDGFPTPFEIEMENHKTRHRTELTIKTIRYGANFPDKLFTQRALERGGGQ
ncbi:MAG: outer membrane lipoprotein-sorting protein [Deltaproteobacteria bacterium]|nr:outer membrane lipoprotein-sorting protein [Deltaproteobacteria bacterium]